MEITNDAEMMMHKQKHIDIYFEHLIEDSVINSNDAKSKFLKDINLEEITEKELHRLLERYYDYYLYERTEEFNADLELLEIRKKNSNTIEPRYTLETIKQIDNIGISEFLKKELGINERIAKDHQLIDILKGEHKELKEQMDNTLNTQDDIDSSRDCPEEFIRKRAKAMDELMSKYILEVSNKLDSV